MIWLIRRLRGDFRAWERSTRIAFVMSMILLLVALILTVIAPPDARVPILVGIGLLLIVLEASVLWGNRGMISVFTRAQRLYMAGDLEAARDLLEAARAARPKADARTLTLLGNTYRQLGQLHESEAVLSEAIDKAPERYFSFYGFGRTLLSEGRYAEAADAIRRALELGAPAVVQADLGEAYYRLNQADDAIAALRAATNGGLGEPQRALMVSYLLFRLGQGDPPTLDAVLSGLPYWEATAERFQTTPYGTALMLDVRDMLNQGQGQGT
ncbi:MAG: tetratricopeptide repeat protein [Chloroflexota bacterium]